MLERKLADRRDPFVRRWNGHRLAAREKPVGRGKKRYFGRPRSARFHGAPRVVTDDILRQRRRTHFISGQSPSETEKRSEKLRSKLTLRHAGN
jgi:hypothetical protein